MIKSEIVCTNIGAQLLSPSYSTFSVIHLIQKPLHPGQGHSDSVAKEHWT